MRSSLWPAAALALLASLAACADDRSPLPDAEGDAGVLVDTGDGLDAEVEDGTLDAGVADSSDLDGAPDAGPDFEVTYLKSAQPERSAAFGRFHALSGDGALLAVGDPFPRAPGAPGRVRLIDLNHPALMERVLLGPQDGEAPRRSFGRALSLSATASVLAVGMPHDQLHAGRAFLFRRPGDGASEPHPLMSPDSLRGDGFGACVIVSPDASLIAVGAPTYPPTPADEPPGRLIPGPGAVYVYTTTSSAAPTVLQTLQAPWGDAGDSFGSALAMSQDGSVVAVGAPGEDSPEADAQSDSVPDSGVVFVFRRQSGTFVEVDRVKAPVPSENARFGAAVALSASGDLLVVGAPGDVSDAVGVDGVPGARRREDSGAVHIFERQTGWVATAFVKASNTHARARFGEALGLTADGRRLLVGAPGESGGGRGIDADSAVDIDAGGSGAVFILERGPTQWTHSRYLKAPNADSNDAFAWASSDAAGRLVIVGAPGEDSDAAGPGGDPHNDLRPDSGAIYLYRRPAP